MEWEYPYNDEYGMYCVRTIGGKKVKIYKDLGLAKSMKKSNKFNKKKTISKKEYGRLAHLIDSNPDKWKIGYNAQIIDDKVYYFNYVSYNTYELIYVLKYKGE